MSNRSAPEGNAAVRYIAIGLIVAFTAISVVNALVVATLDRERQVAPLHRVGATRRQILRMVHAETLAALLVALVLGAASSAAATLAGVAAGITGSAVPTVTAAAAVAIVVAAGALSYLGTTVAARTLIRAPRHRRRGT